jgi:exosortase C (VPDSG-CTERM-specific)
MPSSSNEAAAREAIISAQPGRDSRFAPSNHAKTWRFWSGSCFLIVLLAVFGQNLWVLVNYAARSDLYSYILLVPFVSAYLLYIRRDRLPKNYGTDFRLAIVSLVIAAGIFIFSYWSNFEGGGPTDHNRLALLTLSFLCCLAAGGFFFFGRDWMRSAAFPLAYLIFMVPMPDSMRDALELASKSASAEVANLLFHLSGTPFIRDGAVFQLPNITIQVAQECSGIRSSLVLLMTGILAANLFLKTSWRRIVLVAFVIPLGILRNGFRILVIGLLCANVGPEMIHSPIHTRGGPVFFVLSLIPFLLLLWWLHKGETRARSLEAGRSS